MQVGWARERWTDRFFSETIPQFASSGILKKGGSIFLPNLPGVQDAIANFNTEISSRYNITFVANPMKNPLYKVTNDSTIEKELLRCPDILTNTTQLKPLLNFSSHPFYQLICMNDAPVLSHASSSPRRSQGVVMSPSQSSESDSSRSSSGQTSSSSSSSSSSSRKRKAHADAVDVAMTVTDDQVGSRAARLLKRGSVRELQSEF